MGPAAAGQFLQSDSFRNAALFHPHQQRERFRGELWLAAFVLVVRLAPRFSPRVLAPCCFQFKQPHSARDCRRGGSQTELPPQPLKLLTRLTGRVVRGPKLFGNDIQAALWLPRIKRARVAHDTFVRDPRSPCCRVCWIRRNIGSVAPAGPSVACFRSRNTHALARPSQLPRQAFGEPLPHDAVVQ
jgi:hypothetical protein